MSTWAVISVKQEDGTYKSISVANDGYIQNPGVGYMLSTYYTYPEIVNMLVDLGNLSRLTSRLKEDNIGFQLVKQNSLQDLLNYCVAKLVDYLYVYEDRKWKWASNISSLSNPEISLKELTTSETMDYADEKMVDKPVYCSFRTAVRWGDTNIVLLNNIREIDPDFDPYESFYEDSDEEDDGENYTPEFYQFYITDMSDDDVEWRKKVFPGIIYVYSELLSSWILCVTHYGTSWDYVPTQYIGHINISKEEFERFNKGEEI